MPPEKIEILRTMRLLGSINTKHAEKVEGLLVGNTAAKQILLKVRQHASSGGCMWCLTDKFPLLCKWHNT